MAPDDVKYFFSDTLSCKSNLARLRHAEKEHLRSLLNFIIGVSPSIVLQEWRKTDAQAQPPGGLPISILRKIRISEALVWKKIKERFNDDDVTKRLVQFVKEEKPHFTNDVDPIDLSTATVTIPRKNNIRIAAQFGAFVYFGLRRYLGFNVIGKMQDDIEVPAEAKQSILSDLKTIGIDAGTVYPELGKTTDRINQRFFKRP